MLADIVPAMQCMLGADPEILDQELDHMGWEEKETCRPLETILLIALPPPPPTPITLMRASPPAVQLLKPTERTAFPRRLACS